MKQGFHLSLYVPRDLGYVYPVSGVCKMCLSALIFFFIFSGHPASGASSPEDTPPVVHVHVHRTRTCAMRGRPPPSRSTGGVPRPHPPCTKWSPHGRARQKDVHLEDTALCRKYTPRCENTSGLQSPAPSAPTSLTGAKCSPRARNEKKRGRKKRGRDERRGGGRGRCGAVREVRCGKFLAKKKCF